MKITYLDHSGFLVETNAGNYLFDYIRGEIPKMEPHKPLYVLVSHRHGDHFNPEIFKLRKKYPSVTFILSYDIKVNSYRLNKWEIEEKEDANIISVRANTTYEIDDFKLSTLKSTDAGVAFILQTKEETIYHAGDLNWWYWEGESKSLNNNMTASFKREIDKMTDVSVDVAFVPLDGRQEAYYYLGLAYFMEKVNAKHIFPMHFWGDFSLINQFIEEGHGKGKEDYIIRMTKEGESFTIQ